MKKALSVLLVVAALFGFYGSAVTVNDLLACKDYWEEAGEKSTADMNKLEDGLNQLLENEEAYLDGQDQLADAEVQLAAGEAKLAKGEADYAAAPGKLAKGKADLAAGKAAYNAGKKEYEAGKKEYKESEAKLNKLKSAVSQLSEGFDSWHSTYAGDGTAANPGLKPMYEQLKAYGAVDNDGNAQDVTGNQEVMGPLQQALMNAINSIERKKTDETTGEEVVDVEATTAAKTAYVTAAAGLADPDTAATSLKTILTKAKTEGDTAVETVATNIGALLKAKGLHDGKASLVAGFKELLGNLKGNKEAEAAVKELKIPNVTSVATLSYALGTLNDAGFDYYAPLLIGAANKLIESSDAQLAAGKKKLESAEKQLAAGLKKIRKGEADYAQGLKDYAAAPGQLEEGRQQLADGYKQYEDGKAQLAQYEDGEQQIRDGLATLFNTEADLELESIANRLNGDGDFDNGDNHLEIDEGLNAVEVGRGYQAEDGVLITNEIMGRAVATGGLIGAAVLAVLAAILSFLKKNKGAAVFALLAAAAGAFGAFYGPAQGTYFSDIAGSTVGATTWVAAGVLGAVALVHAIAHFAAKKAA